MLRFSEYLPVYNQLILIAYDALSASGMQIAELQQFLTTNGFNLLGQELWKGDSIWLPCGNQLPKFPENIGVVFTIETADQAHRSCGAFFLDASVGSFMVGPWLGSVQTKEIIPFAAFRPKSGPRRTWGYEEIYGQD